MADHSLKRLFQAQSVAVIGASQSPGKAGHEILRALLGFGGPVYPVNPAAREILGRPALASIADAGSTIDLAIIALPAALCPDAVTAAAEAGVGAVMIVSGGFAETGEAGKALQRGILDTCRRHGVRLLGPNTSGFANPHIGLTANFAPGMDNLDPGCVAIISQSGAVTLAMTGLAADRGLGISLAVGTGNGLNVSPADVIEHLADDDDTRVIVAYLEGVSDGRRLYDVVSRTTPRKPVVVYTVGKADIGDFAASHTGNLIGSYDLKVAALRQAGALVIDTLEELMDAAQVFSCVRLAPNPDPGVGLLTGQAGPGMIIADYLRSHGICLPELGHETVTAIAKHLPPLTYLRNPVDTGRPGGSFGKILELIGDDPAVDVVLTFALHEPAAVDPVNLFTDRADSISRPLVFGTAGNSSSTAATVRALADLGIPAFVTPNRAASAVRLLSEDAKAAWRLQSGAAACDAAAESGGMEEAPNEVEAKRLLASIGIPCPDGVLCRTHEEAFAAFRKLGPPCVVKIVSSRVTHKTEIDGVHTGIENREALASALAGIDAIDGVDDAAYLVEKMAAPGLEMIVGAKRDGSFGPAVLAGLGGTLAEALQDVSMRMAPLSENEAMDMLLALRGAAMFDGWRGSPALDKRALARALVSLGRFMLHHPEVREVDINPVRIYPDGLLALDALMITSPA